ncbi:MULTISPECIES: Rha family transcriptional regulator [Convivina]|uniref:Phage regulator Rha-like protein n=2 Tax=Convivina TaxID=1697027 RepID=A0A2U1D5Y4_9LACO|nr:MULTISPECIES: Rha family transcriptional regulator [Convivina]SDB97956.1 Phage regulatory protein Rha [Leuconostocaceae bacterium R-53105]PVY83093.1 phage regulator Rha-like protein [Convivina intestini]CAH1849966.1 hypothetical protein R078138_00037 [Convivina sp. LMG 32447]CAH1856165.1 hypothetical protein LMG032447_01246 [Convivina sp. LMG 32447]CAH1856622.1 hypothetical protein R077811_01294 [Convivina intestini]
MELVYYHGLTKEPFTTAKVISDFSGVDIESINRLTRTHKERLKKFGKLHYSLEKVKDKTDLKSVLSKQRSSKIWHYNERQATVLITYLRNTDKVLDFKDALVNAFYEMKQELDKRRVERQVNRLLNIGLAETIKEYLPDDKHAYSNYHRLAFSCTTGMTQAQYKNAYGVDDPQSALDSVQSQRLERVKQHIALYIQDGKEYQDIKRQLLADF